MTKNMAAALSVEDVAARFNTLAQEEKWFQIQDELFADDVQSVEPAHSRYFKNANGKLAVRKKGEEWVALVRGVHKLSTSEPIVARHHFAVARFVDIDVEGYGRVVMNELMVYEVKDGKIVVEQFYY